MFQVKRLCPPPPPPPHSPHCLSNLPWKVFTCREGAGAVQSFRLRTVDLALLPRVRTMPTACPFANMSLCAPAPSRRDIHLVYALCTPRGCIGSSLKPQYQELQEGPKDLTDDPRPPAGSGLSGTSMRNEMTGMRRPVSGLNCVQLRS